jgi:hypothetical protein
MAISHSRHLLFSLLGCWLLLLLAYSNFSGEDEVSYLVFRASMHPKKEAMPRKEGFPWQQAIMAR